MSEFPSRVVLKASDRYPVFLEVGVFAFASLALDLLLADPVCSELSNTIASSEDCVLLEEFVSLFIFFMLLDFGDASAAAASPNVFSASRYCASETLESCEGVLITDELPSIDLDDASRRRMLVSFAAAAPVCMSENRFRRGIRPEMDISSIAWKGDEWWWWLW